MSVFYLANTAASYRQCTQPASHQTTLQTIGKNTRSLPRLLQPFNSLCPGLPGWAGTGQVKNNLNFTEARDSGWQWHQLGHMQVCTSPRMDNHASTPPLIFLQAGCPSCHQTNSVKELKASANWHSVGASSQQQLPLSTFYVHYTLQRTCISWHPQLRTGGFYWSKVLSVHMPLLVATSTFELGRKRWVLLSGVTYIISEPSLVVNKKHKNQKSLHVKSYSKRAYLHLFSQLHSVCHSAQSLGRAVHAEYTGIISHQSCHKVGKFNIIITVIINNITATITIVNHW